MDNFSNTEWKYCSQVEIYGTHGGQGSLNLATGDQGGAKQTLRDRERARAHHQQQKHLTSSPEEYIYTV